VPIRLLDTAGLRTSASKLEREGIARTEKSLQTADLRLHIVDGNAPRPPHFEERADNGSEIMLLNKSDLPEHRDWKHFETLRISCATGEGLPELEKEILARITKQNLKPESTVVINTRHRDCLRRALESCNRARMATRDGLTTEYVAVDLNEALWAVGEEIAALLATADQGRILREGVRVVIYGATNAGKSSLLNQLLGYERVIVSETHGTTRDMIEEMINLRGVPIRLLDTAGLRTSASKLEREGIARTEKSLQTADLRLHIVDGNAPRPPHFEERADNGSEIVLLNKSDLPEHRDWKHFETLRISCATGEGLPELEKEMLARITKQNLKPESTVAINTRHRDCLRRALESCNRARMAMRDGLTTEYVAVDLNEALCAVGEVIGVVDVEHILDSVFGQFCIGK